MALRGIPDRFHGRRSPLRQNIHFPGMMFTIEPMINQGSPEFYVDEDNGWTVYTDDDGLSAQIEYMVLIKEDGVEVLTK